MSEEVFTIDDVLSLLDEVEPKRGGRAYEALITSLREGPLSELYRRIEEMADDAGTDRRLVGWEREAVLHHRTVESLLGSESWEQVAELIAEDALEIDYQALLNICAARRRRGEGDPERLEGVERALRLMLAAQRQRADDREDGSGLAVGGLPRERVAGRSNETAGSAAG